MISSVALACRARQALGMDPPAVGEAVTGNLTGGSSCSTMLRQPCALGTHTPTSQTSQLGQQQVPRPALAQQPQCSSTDARPVPPHPDPPPQYNELERQAYATYKRYGEDPRSLHSSTSLENRSTTRTRHGIYWPPASSGGLVASMCNDQAALLSPPVLQLRSAASSPLFPHTYPHGHPKGGGSGHRYALSQGRFAPDQRGRSRGRTTHTCTVNLSSHELKEELVGALAVVVAEVAQPEHARACPSEHASSSAPTRLAAQSRQPQSEARPVCVYQFCRPVNGSNFGMGAPVFGSKRFCWAVPHGAVDASKPGNMRMS